MLSQFVADYVVIIKAISVVHPELAPETLLINMSRNLTRFMQGNSGGFQQKKNLQAVEFPDVLDVTDWLEPNDYGAGSVSKYRLSGVVSHSGPAFDSGHYVSFVRDARHQDSWYGMNDRTVSTRIL